MKYTFYYGLLHWLGHYFLAGLLLWVTAFSLIDIIVPVNLVNLIIPVNLINLLFTTRVPMLTVQFHIIDLLIVFVLTTIVDADHVLVFKRYGRKGILRFAQTRITYPFHNFFIISIFSITSAFSALLLSRILAVLLLVPVVHLLWDMFEDVFIFRTTYRKWEKTWGIGSRELADLWKEWERIDKQLKKQDKLIRKQK